MILTYQYGLSSIRLLSDDLNSRKTPKANCPDPA